MRRAPSLLELFTWLPTVGMLLLAVPVIAQPEGSCVEGVTTVCLLSDRFSVEVDWDDTFTSGKGQVIPLATDDTGSFFYQDARYAELVVRILDGCALNDSFWIFSIGLSDAIQTITVTDTTLGSVQTYDNALGDFPTLTDVNALPCNPPPPFAEPEVAKPRSRTESTATSVEGVQPALQLADGRFRVEVDWDNMSSTGIGQPQQITSHSGAFWFFVPDTFEMAVKLFDGTAVNGSFWVFFGGVTSVGYTVRVTDTCTGAQQNYVVPFGTGSSSSVDMTAFGSAGCDIFSDGFESGNTTAWSTTFP
ncbi:MAG: hypothetical protein MPN21_12315 [Thermoanaerobaculia bacterium]|nr:hypothetical protein [Thermoanaerobaculia bacterium]